MIIDTAFLKDIRLSNNRSKGKYEVPLPYRRVLHDISLLQNNCIILLPYFSESDFLIPLLHTFSQVYTLTKHSQRKITDYSIGDTLILNDYVFKYQGIDAFDKTKVRLEFACNLVQLIPISKCPLFIKSSQVRLSQSNGFYAKLMENQENNNLLMDIVVANQFDYKYTNIYFTVKHKAIEELSSIWIDNKSIIDEFIIGNLVKDRVEIIGTRKKQGKPIILAVSNIEYMYNFVLNNIKDIGVVFIEDEGFKLINKNIAILDMLLDANVKIVVISDNITYVQDTIVKHKGFKIIDVESIYQGAYPMEYSFKDFDQRLKYYQEMNVVPKIIENTTINNSKKLLKSIYNLIKEETGEVQDIYFKILSIFYRLADRISYIDTEEKQTFIKEYSKILQDLKIHKKFMNNNVYKTLLLCIDNFVKLSKSEPLTDSKYRELSTILRKVDIYSKIAIIYDRNQDLRTIEKTLIPFKYLNIVLLTEDQYNDINTNWDLSICTIFYSKTYEHVISKWNYSKLVLFLYDYQKKFLEIKSNRYNKISFFSKGEMIENQEKNVFEEMLEDEQAEVISSERRYKAYAASKNDQFQTVEALPILFSNDYLTFYRENKKVFEVSSVIRGISSGVNFKEAKDINVGDYIAVRESDKDIIRTAADQILERQGKLHLRDIASQWRTPLINLNKFGFDNAYKRLISHGCNKDPMTIRNWIVNEDVIGPGSIEDLKILLNLDIKNNVDVIKVEEAIREIRSVHQKVGREMSKNLGEYILKSKMKMGKSSTFTNELYIENIGNIKILRVNHIGTKMQISVAETNKLHGGN